MLGITRVGVNDGAAAGVAVQIAIDSHDPNHTAAGADAAGQARFADEDLATTSSNVDVAVCLRDIDLTATGLPCECPIDVIDGDLTARRVDADVEVVRDLDVEVMPGTLIVRVAR